MRSDESSEPELFVQCYARPALVLEPIDSKIRTLQQLSKEDTIAGLDLRYWPCEVQWSETVESEPLRAYRRFSEWADACAVDVHPPFRRRHSQTLADTSGSHMLVTPVMALALYDEGRLVGVFPHRDEAVHRSVADAIAALRTGHIGELLASLPTPSEPIRPVSPQIREQDTLECPDCSGSLLNVQGILTCTNCKREVNITPSTTETQQSSVPDQ